MNTKETVGSQEIAFSLALSLSLTLTFLRAIRQMNIDGGIAVPDKWEELIKQLHTLFLDSCRVAGKDFIETGDEKSAALMGYVLKMSRPNGARDDA
jgi:hypothetical protein